MMRRAGEKVQLDPAIKLQSGRPVSATSLWCLASGLAHGAPWSTFDFSAWVEEL